MTKMFAECQLAIKTVVKQGQTLLISKLMPTQEPYDKQAITELSALGLKADPSSVKVVQYETSINKKSKQISTCVVFYLNADIPKAAGVEDKIKARGYQPVDKNSEIAKKIFRGDWACMEFLSEEGDTVAVHEKQD